MSNLHYSEVFNKTMVKTFNLTFLMTSHYISLLKYPAKHISTAVVLLLLLTGSPMICMCLMFDDHIDQGNLSQILYNGEKVENFQCNIYPILCIFSLDQQLLGLVDVL